MRPSFGIFDHIEDIPGTPTPQLLRDRLDLIKMADEAGFAQVLVEDLARQPEVRLQAWARVEGQLKIGSKPGANESVNLWPRGGWRHS